MSLAMSKKLCASNWKRISGYGGGFTRGGTFYETYYEVSDHGEIRNGRTGRIIAQCKQKDGYKQVSIMCNDKSKSVLVHRLLMETFHPRPDMDTLEVNHKDLDKTNNLETNLEWTTHKENMDHAVSNKAMSGPRSKRPGTAVGTDNTNCRITEDVAKAIKYNCGQYSNKDLAALLGTTVPTVYAIRTGRSRKYI